MSRSDNFSFDTLSQPIIIGFASPGAYLGRLFCQQYLTENKLDRFLLGQLVCMKALQIQQLMISEGHVGLEVHDYSPCPTCV